MTRPFFSIITRTMPGRERLFARCCDSVRAQSFREVEHLILRDEFGVGVCEAQRMMWKSSPRGEYVLVLDDDDFLTAPDVLEKLHAALSAARPCFAVVKVQHDQIGEMPLVWGDGEIPQEGQITVSNVIVEHVQWYLHRDKFGVRYAGDFDFVKSLFDSHMPQWIDVTVVTVEQRRNGTLESVEMVIV
jgi:hypothetical protein